jgi:hypothetical protein
MSCGGSMVKKGVVPVRFKVGDQFRFVNDPTDRIVQNVTIENKVVLYNFGPISEGEPDFRLTQHEVEVNMSPKLYEDAVSRHTAVYP